jgi:L-rhamnose mutarotase
MKSIGLALTLREGAYDEYKKRHDEIWPEMVEALNSCEITMVIYKRENTLFVHQRAPSEESFVKMGAHPITPKWNDHMAEVLETDAKGNIVFEMLPLAFGFGEFQE